MQVKLTGVPAGTNGGKTWGDVGDTVDVSDDKAVELANAGVASPVDLTAVADVPSVLVAEAQARHEYAQTEYATPQEKKQAAVELADATDIRPQGSHAQLHETVVPVRAVVDEQHAKTIETSDAELLANKGPVEQQPTASGVAGIPGNLPSESMPTGDGSASTGSGAAVGKAAAGKAGK